VEHPLTPLQWSEIQSAHTHLGVILAQQPHPLNDEEWGWLHHIQEHVGEMVGFLSVQIPHEPAGST
jgi:hypothetical protein